MLILPLWQMSASSLAVGQSLAAILDISNELRVALNARVNQEPGATMLIMGRPHWAPERVSLILTVREGLSVPADLEQDLVRIVRDIVGAYTPVHVVFLQDLTTYDARGSSPPIIGWPD